MTNSTDNNTDSKSKKKNKKKGPLRIEAIVPLIVLLGLGAAYFHFFFDSHLRAGASWAATKVHGAEVNIGDIDSSLFGGYLHVFNIQVTDKDKPEQNLVAVGAVKFNLLWDALLRAKFVIEEASIKDIQLYSPRKRPGRILPKSETTRENKTFKEVEKTALKTTEEEFQENVLGDVAKVLGGTDPTKQLESMQKNLQSDKKIAELKAALKDKEKEWDERIKKLPDNSKIKALEARFKKLKFNTKNIPQFLKDVKEAEKIKKEADGYIKEVSSAAKTADGDLKTFDKEVKGIDDWVKKDIADLQKRLKIPDLNVNDLSKKIFLKMMQDKLGPYAKYIDMAREYMPPKKPKAKADYHKKNVIQKRQIGKTFMFPVTVSYPLFWLKKAVISSKSTESGFSGDIEGLMENFTSDPVSLKKPATIKIKGDFPKQQVFGLNAKVILDHTSDNPRDSIAGVVASFPAGRQVLSGSDDLTFAIAESKGQSKFSALMYQNNFQAKVFNKFTDVKYEVDAKNKDVKKIFTQAASDVPEITLDTQVAGIPPKLNWKIDSNLGRELGRSLKRQVQAKIDAAKKELNNFVQQKIAGEKAKLNSEFGKFKGELDGKVAKVKNDLEKSKKDIEKKVKKSKKKSENAQKKKIEKKGKKALEDLKKKFKF